MRSPVLAACAGALLTASAMAGCSASVTTGDNLDIDKLETTIASEIEQQLDLSGTPTVTCPDEVKIEKDAVFTCTAELEGDSVDVQVTQTDDEGNVTWETVQPDQ
jgi:hypothetical protein